MKKFFTDKTKRKEKKVSCYRNYHLFLFAIVISVSRCIAGGDDTIGNSIPEEKESFSAYDRETKLQESIGVAGNDEQQHPHPHQQQHPHHHQQKQHQSWTKFSFPNPQYDPKLCRCSKSDRICDPDSVLTEDEISSIETNILEDRKCSAMQQKEQQQCRESLSTEENNLSEDESTLDIQIGVAILKKMDLQVFTTNDGRSDHVDEETAVEIYARSIHDEWGVGLNTACGGTGILIFLSIYDRAMYISRGSGIEYLLTDKRLDGIIEYTMKPLLKEEKYGLAIQSCIEQISHYILIGPPTLWGNGGELFWQYFWEYFFPVCYILFVIGYILWKIVYQRKQKQLYTQVATQLNELDRARAEALQGRYRTTSCPICLQDFIVNSDDNSNDDNGINDDVVQNTSETATDEQHQQQEQMKTVVLGSDRQPIKLLRCGHVFDESCWAEWVSSGQGDITKCPICQQDVGGNDNIDNNNNSMLVNNNQQNLHHPSDENDDGERNDNVILQRRDVQPQQQQQRIIQQVYRERNFRLARLAHRYPQFIRPQQIQRWTQSTYDGSLVRDPSFVKSNPTHARATTGGRGGSAFGSSGSSFGGGSSGGGRGSRW